LPDLNIDSNIHRKKDGGLRMAKDLTIKGLVLGITTGLLVTLCDGFFMLTPNTYVPLSYPLLLITFNTLFWMTVGGLSGFILWIFVRKRGNLQEKENFYWFLFFLLPFAMIYGLLGRLYIPPSIWTVNFGKPVFDHHLSFLWILVILAFFAFNLRKMENRKGFLPLFFTFEIATFIMFFQFCSNLSYIKIPGFYYSHQNFFQNIKLELDQFLIVVYILGVLSIAGLYCITRLTMRTFFTKGKPVRSDYFTIVVLFFIVSVSLAAIFSWSQRGYIRKEFPSLVAKQNKETIKVPYVILIVLDTVRADRLSIYSDLETSKNLTVFSRDALVFENCVATSPWTIPSHASLFTGFYPTEHGSHGILDPKKKGMFGLPLTSPLTEEFMTLAEIFRDNCYITGAVVSNSIILNPYLKLDQGFQISDGARNIGEVYNKYPFHPILHLFCYLTNVYPKYTLFYKAADDITSQSIHLLKNLLPSPIFLFINYLDAHGPYNPPRPFSGYFLDTPFPHLQKLKQYLLRLMNRVDEKSRDAYQLSQYDGELAYIDDELGRFFSQLKNMGIYDSSFIIITSDHGELFGEHGLYWHRNRMYEGVVKIPLLIKFPHSKIVGHEKRMITLADLYPTILSICELPIPTVTSGKAFGDASSIIVSELYEYETGEHRVLYNGKYKYMRYGYKRGPELYDLEEDPLEKENLAEKLPEVTLAMEGKLKHWEKVHGPNYSLSAEKKEVVPKELVEGLKALGYIQ
jgi:arylsulfatase A-like enzyme